MMKRIFLLVIILFVTKISFATIEKSDTINVDETWSEDTVKVTDDIYIQDGVTLTINPGVYVEFQGHYKIDVQGRVLAEGSAENKIIFTAKDTILTDTSGGWHGIRFENTPSSNDTSIFNFCNFSYGNAYTTVDDYDEEQGGSIRIFFYYKVKVLNSMFRNNRAADVGGAISSSYGSSKIINCLFYQNSAKFGGALSFGYSGNPILVNNTIMNNSSGVYCFLASPIIINTVLWNNNSYEIYDYNENAQLSYCNTMGKVFEGEGNISQDPLVKNSGNDNYYLTDASPCINLGAPNWTNDSLCSSEDILGNIRVKHGRVDIGAFEYQEFISPRGIEISNDTIEESCDSSIFVGLLTSVHPYPTASYVYSFDKNSVNNDTTSFYISNDSLFTAVNNFDFESKDTYSLYIKTIDNNDMSCTDLITIHLKDVNETPTDINISNIELDENSEIGVVIGSFSTIDQDAIDNFTYAISSGDGLNDIDSSYFKVDGKRLLVDKLPNYEVKKNLKVVIRSTDKGGLYVDKDFTININDIAEYGIDPYQSMNRTGAVQFVIDSTLYIGLGNSADSVMCNFWKYNINEDIWTEIPKFPGNPRSEAVSFVIDGKAYVGLGRSEYPYTYYKDFFEYNPETNQWTQIAEFGGTARYNAVAFAIDSLGYVGTGIDATDEQKDFWKYDPDLDSWTQVADINGDKRHGASAFVINGKAYVTGGQYFDSYSVQLSDVREYDPATDTWQEKIYADGMNLSINEAATLVMGDKGFICYGNKSNIVRYDPETNEVINYGDLLGLGDSRFDPIAFVLDSTAYFGLGYYDVMDPYYQNDILELNHFPFNITLSNDTIEENSNANTIIGTFSAEDEDLNESFSYSFAFGDGMNDADNNSFIISGNELQNNEVFDFESKNKYHILIQVEDSLGATFQKPFIINIKDINESPTNIELSNNTIDENSPEGTIIGTFSTIDEDNGDTHTYILVVGNGTNDADNSGFTISGNELQNTGVFNYESQSEYYIYVATEDEGGEIYENAFIISVNDINESPTDIELSNNTIDENSPEGTVIGILSTIDEDNDDSHSYSLTTGDGTNDAGNSSFIISSDSLQNADVFDFETQNEYYIFIETDDGNGGSFQKAFVITVNDVTEVGIEDFGSKNIKVFPNPTNGIFKLDFSDAQLEKYEIKIINSSGQIVYKNQANDNIVKIDLSDHSKGIYVLFLESPEFKGFEKIILK